MSRLSWDRTVEPNLRDKFSGANVDDMENSIFPVQITMSRIGNHTRLTPSQLKGTTTYTYKNYLDAEP